MALSFSEADGDGEDSVALTLAQALLALAVVAATALALHWLGSGSEQDKDVDKRSLEAGPTQSPQDGKTVQTPAPKARLSSEDQETKAPETPSGPPAPSPRERPGRGPKDPESPGSPDGGLAPRAAPQVRAPKITSRVAPPKQPGDGSQAPLRPQSRAGAPPGPGPLLIHFTPRHPDPWSEGGLGGPGRPSLLVAAPPGEKPDDGRGPSGQRQEGAPSPRIRSRVRGPGPDPFSLGTVVSVWDAIDAGSSLAAGDPLLGGLLPQAPGTRFSAPEEAPAGPAPDQKWAPPSGSPRDTAWRSGGGEGHLFLSSGAGLAPTAAQGGADSESGGGEPSPGGTELPAWGAPAQAVAPDPEERWPWKERELLITSSFSRPPNALIRQLEGYGQGSPLPIRKETPEAVPAPSQVSSDPEERRKGPVPTPASPEGASPARDPQLPSTSPGSVPLVASEPGSRAKKGPENTPTCTEGGAGDIQAQENAPIIQKGPGLSSSSSSGPSPRARRALGSLTSVTAPGAPPPMQSPASVPAPTESLTSAPALTGSLASAPVLKGPPVLAPAPSGSLTSTPVPTVSLSKAPLSAPSPKESPSSVPVPKGPTSPASASTGSPSSAPTSTGSPSSAPTSTGSPSSAPTSTGSPSSAPASTGGPSSIHEPKRPTSPAPAPKGSVSKAPEPKEFLSSVPELKVSPSVGSASQGPPSSVPTPTASPTSSPVPPGSLTSAPTSSGSLSSAPVSMVSSSSAPAPSGPPSLTPAPSGPPTLAPAPSGPPSLTPALSGSPTLAPAPSGPTSLTPASSGSPSLTPAPSGSPSLTLAPSGSPTSATAPSGSPTLAPASSGPPSLTPAPSGSLSLTPVPSGSPTLAPAPSGPPSLTPAPSGSPSLTPAPSGSPSLTLAPSGSLTSSSPLSGSPISASATSGSPSLTPGSSGSLTSIPAPSGSPISATPPSGSPSSALTPPELLPSAPIAQASLLKDLPPVTQNPPGVESPTVSPALDPTPGGQSVRALPQGASGSWGNLISMVLRSHPFPRPEKPPGEAPGTSPAAVPSPGSKTGELTPGGNGVVKGPQAKVRAPPPSEKLETPGAPIPSDPRGLNGAQVEEKRMAKAELQSVARRPSAPPEAPGHPPERKPEPAAPREAVPDGQPAPRPRKRSICQMADSLAQKVSPVVPSQRETPVGLVAPLTERQLQDSQLMAFLRRPGTWGTVEGQRKPSHPPEDLSSTVAALRRHLDLGSCVEALAFAQQHGELALAEEVYALMSDNFLLVLGDAPLYRQLGAGDRERILALRSTRGQAVLGVLVLPSAYGGSRLGLAGGSQATEPPAAPSGPVARTYLHMFEPGRNAWLPLALVPEEAPLRGCGLCTMHNYLFLAGGIRGSGPGAVCTNEVFCYNPLTDIWTQVRPMLQARAQLKLVALEGLLYAIGGECLYSMECYDPRTDHWTSRAPLPAGTFPVAHEAVACRGDIYVTGGHLFYRLLKYSPPRDCWAECPYSASHRRSSDMVALGGFLYRFDLLRGVGAAVMRYNTVTGSWSQAAPLPLPEPIPLRCAVLGNTIYCLNQQVTATFTVSEGTAQFEARQLKPFPMGGKGVLCPFTLTLPALSPLQTPL
ncbi:kelch domain-containing protein 7B [Sminthopsis crassicaudata]|uniref:kelch domain-containing protein 7B n=1 Tax=Sminthopsis crassicaudata TaxID=9301 RepID=UPI003D683CFE